MVSSFIALIVSFFVEKRIPYFGLFAASTIFLFGGLTTYFDNPFYIMIKDTVYELFFAFFIGICLLQKKYIFKFFFADFFAITEKGWKTLSLRWFFFFIVLGIGNEIARRMLVPEMWTFYKLISVLVTWIFGFYQLTLTKRERLEEGSSWGLRVKENR